MKKKNDLLQKLSQEGDQLAYDEDRYDQLIKQIDDVEVKIKEFQERLEDEEEMNNDLIAKKRQLEDECSELKASFWKIQIFLTKNFWFSNKKLTDYLGRIGRKFQVTKNFDWSKIPIDWYFNWSKISIVQKFR